MTRTVHLIERRTREVRLPPGDVAFLVAHARHLVDVTPAFRRGFYRITPREFVGWFHTPTRRFALAPKIPWPNARMLLGLPPLEHEAGTAGDPEAALLDAFAREFAARLREVTRAGLVAGYREQDTAATFLRGKLRAGDQIRDAAARAFPDRFQITECVLDLDTPWNRIPRAVAAELLANPDLGRLARDELRNAITPLAEVPVSPVNDADFASAETEPRATHYGPLLIVCRLLHDGFAAARLGEAGTGAFLVDLSRAFERYLAAGLTEELAPWAGWSVEAQARFAVGPAILQPDLLLRKRGKCRVVLDAKWKVPGPAPHPADLHQILAYAAVTGAKHVGLVYPGCRFARREFALPGRDIRVSLLRVRVVGTSEECGRSLRRLGRFVRMRRP